MLPNTHPSSPPILPENNLSSSSSQRLSPAPVSSISENDLMEDDVTAKQKQQPQHKESSSSSDLNGLETKFDRALRLEAETRHRVPSEDLTPEELDSLLARDMYSLSLDERSKVMNDMHGVPDNIQETPEFLSKSQTQLAEELNSCIFGKRNKHLNTQAYQQALQQNSNYVTSTKIQLAFLRSENFHIKKSASRIVQFFQLKLDLFGPDKLTQDITMNDLSKDDKRSAEAGSFQLLQVRDSAGRAIMMGIPCLRNYKTAMNFKRGFYYMVMTAIHDESTQKNGLVFVGYNMGKNRIVDRTMAWNVSQLRKVLPMRITGVHYCYDDFKMRPMITVATLVMGTTNRVRFRSHYGKMKETFFKLQTFGIPTQTLPITADGEPKNKSHRQWLKARAKQEGEILRGSGDVISYNSNEFIVVPNRLDVLFGRGKPIQEHFGNIRYHSLLDYYQDAYERAKKFEKMQISKRVVDTVHAFEGRFLKQEGSGWAAVNDTVARDKVSHAFRTRRASTANNIAASSTARSSPPPNDVPVLSPSPPPMSSIGGAVDTTSASSHAAVTSRNVDGKRLLEDTLPPSPATTATMTTNLTKMSTLLSTSETDHDFLNAPLFSGVVDDNLHLQNSDICNQSSLVSDTENDDFNHLHNSDEELSIGGKGGGKRARLWQSTFHDIETAFN